MLYAPTGKNMKVGLQELRLDLNVLSGSLPNSWANYCFPLLTSMQLGSNNLSGQLPEQWGAPTAFPAIEVIRAARPFAAHFGLPVVAS